MLRHAGAVARGGDVSSLTGRFTDPGLESAFREHAWPDWSSRVGTLGVLVAVLVLSFGYTDYLALGFGAPLYACWAMRLGFLAGAVAVARVARGPVRVDLLDRSVFALLVWFSLALFVVVALQDKGILVETPGVLLMVLGFYLFVPARFEVQLAGSVFVSGGFLALATQLSATTAAEWTTVALEILICNVLGAFTALRTHVLQRREFLGLRQVRQRARFEELVARLSTRFITLPAEAVDAAITPALAEIGEFTGVDRTYVFEFDADARSVSCTHEWCREGLAPAMIGLKNVPYDAFRWGLGELLAGRAISASRLDDLPPQAEAEKAEARRHGARSLLVLPLIYGKDVHGAIGFHAVRAEIRWDEERVALLRLIGEMIVGLIMHKRTNRQLREQTRSLEATVAALERSNSDLQQFAYVASHDLQEPLRTVSSFAGLLASRYAGRIDAQADEYIRYVTAAAARMHEMITHLLDYSRLDARARPFESCDCAAIVLRAVENLRASIEESHATVTMGKLPELPGDPTQLLQLFQNLIGNALKFQAGRRPEVAIGAERDGPRWLFTVADNGIGIDPQYAQRVFQIFTRLHGRDQYPGTGIGLAICRRIVERHGGRIWVEPNQPAGSRFRFTLPAAK